MNRRLFLSISGLAALIGVSKPGVASAIESTREQPWRVRYVPVHGRVMTQGRLLDTHTGRDVSTLFPMRSAHRLERSLITGQPVLLAVFRQKDGHPFLSGDRLATEPTWVQVIA